jgi:hypothetical protein
MPSDAFPEQHVGREPNAFCLSVGRAGVAGLTDSLPVIDDHFIIFLKEEHGCVDDGLVVRVHRLLQAASM